MTKEKTMANVTEEVEKIAHAKYGREVRKSICDAITAMNEESSEAYEKAIESQKSAVNSATLAESYAKGGTGTREGEDTDNAKYYMEQAKSGVIATTEHAGVVKPDGTTITVDEDGTIHAVGGGGATTESKTLLASGWVGDSAPFTYDLGIASTHDATVLLPNTATATEVEAVIGAQIAGNGTDNILRAWGEKPSIDIPVVVRKVAK